MSPPAPVDAHPSRREGEGAVLFVRDLRTYFYQPQRGRFVRAVDGVTLSIQAGETLVVVGESGSGKSVTMLSLMGLIEAAPGIVHGHVWYRPPNRQEALDLLDGLEHFVKWQAGPPTRVEKNTIGWRRWHDQSMKTRRGRDLAMIFQNPRNALHPHFTVGQQLIEAVRRRAPEKNAREAFHEAEEWLSRVRFDAPSKRMHDYPHNLSGGMCQRVMVAMALAARPVLLIADEPTTGLDATIQSRVLDLMEDVKAEFKTTTIVITHDMGVARRLADRVAVMYAGRVVESGPADLVLDPQHEPKHPYTRGLLASIPTAADVRERRRLAVIEGDVPDLSRLASGCQFAERCALQPAGREYLCRESEPPFERVALKHQLRCWLYLRHASEGPHA
ncbi:MAG: ABC transporter ATP-binding protein [Vicinamibacteria bacterium]|nr:ABC transporter ATP-binding protein [Vicinamibacteria bacterium]